MDAIQREGSEGIALDGDEARYVVAAAKGVGVGLGCDCVGILGTDCS